MIKLLLAVLFIVTAMNTTAQYSQAAKDSAQNEIRQLTVAWNKAIIDRDSAALDKLLAPDYSLNGVVNRSAWMNNTMHHITTDTLQVMGPLQITFYGQLCKAEGLFFWKAAFDAVPKINGEYAITDIWTKRNGHWQVLLRMSLQTKMR